MDVNPSLAPDLFEAVVTAFAETLIRQYRDSHTRARRVVTETPPPRPIATESAAIESPWLRVADAAKRAQCGRSTIYSEVQAGRLRSARVGGGRILRLRAEWVDEWLQGIVPEANSKARSERRR